MKLSCLIVSSIIKKLPLAIQHNIQIQENGLTKLQGISEKDQGYHYLESRLSLFFSRPVRNFHRPLHSRNRKISKLLCRRSSYQLEEWTSSVTNGTPRTLFPILIANSNNPSTRETRVCQTIVRMLKTILHINITNWMYASTIVWWLVPCWVHYCSYINIRNKRWSSFDVPLNVNYYI